MKNGEEISDLKVRVYEDTAIATYTDRNAPGFSEERASHVYAIGDWRAEQF